ncbi:MAG: error-prone DNA polymerase [Candidatus Melainabacteria bacterium]|nr:error-prone DNA polymerase [Candidatus Melainabacteria bacterium]
MRHEYAELHCHSSFSLLDGASNPEELVVRAKEIGLAALALTDHDDLGGAVRFATAAKEVELEAIIGAELTLEDHSHITLLAAEEEGYKNICRLITKSRSVCSRGSPRVAMSDLWEHSDGLIALSGCPHGAIPAAFARGDFDKASNWARQFKEIFGDRFYLELWNHYITQEQVIGKHLLALAKEQSIPWVVTNNVHYSVSDKRIVHDVLTCLRHEVTLAEAGRRLRPNGSWYMKSPEEMAQLWRHDLTGVKNTLVIAERCKFRLGFLRTPLPVFQLEPEIAASSGISPDMSATALLEKLVWEGARLRYPDLTDKHIKQLDHELTMITRIDLAPYFLIMWDIVRFARSRGIAVQGRGSAANSAVCYCLMITAVDPIAMDLLFERFLSEGRNEPPDIDLDIAHQERETVLQYVYEKYGRKHAAMVCEIITYRGRSAVRDAARVLGFSQEQADRLAGEADHSEARGAVVKLLEGGLQRIGLDVNDKRVVLLLKVVAGLHQLPRHRSIHVGGFVLSGRPLGELVPIEPASMHGRTVIQWDKDDIDLVGMIKIDLLGLGMLMMIQEGLKLVKQFRGIDIDLGMLDMHDQAIYKMLQAADTIGLFQVESRAQMSILPKLRPKCFYDIIVSIAIVRPGPIQGNIVHPYLRRRRGEEKVEYLHPTLEPILARTLGVPLFQEQGMKLAVVAAGFTPSQADQLRRVMSHKRSMERMMLLCEDLAAGMRKNNFAEEAIATIIHQLKAFANYGFPESHAASFSLLVYASAYLKLYHAPEFYCAILNAQPMGFYSPGTLVRDAMRHGVEIRAVDLAKSSWNCTLEVVTDDSGFKLALRIGLRFVDGLGRKSKDMLEKSWNSGGSFTSLEDVVDRSGLAPADLKILAQAGAFESLYPGRREALWEILGKLRKRREMPLFDALNENRKISDVDDDEKKLQLPALTQLEEIGDDYRLTGLSPTEHPMAFFRKWADANKIYSCNALEKASDGDIVKVAGAVICRQRPETAKGFVFLTLEDETGLANVIIRPQVFEDNRRKIMTNSFLCVQGRLQYEPGVINVIATNFEILVQPKGSPEIRGRNFH